jgi:hypothetical protein
MTAPVSYNAAQPAAVSAYPALRENNQPDALDSARVALVQDRWTAQDSVRLPFERQVEEHCRLLAGRQWDVFSEQLGRFIDVTMLFSDEEKLWRQRPVVNYLAYWYLLTHARLTENPPIVTFQPSTADRQDAQLAQTLDTIYKTIWNDASMSEAWDRVTGWIVAAGTGYLKSYPDDTEGAGIPARRPRHHHTRASRNGREPIDFDLDGDVPYSKDGTPQFEVQQNETGELARGPDGRGGVREGRPGLRGGAEPRFRSAGNGTPSRGTRRHGTSTVTTTARTKSKAIGMSRRPRRTRLVSTGSGPGYLERLLFGAGHYGATERGGGGISARQMPRVSPAGVGGGPRLCPRG